LLKIKKKGKIAFQKYIQGAQILLEKLEDPRFLWLLKIE
jgi:hypothetical protein